MGFNDAFQALGLCALVGKETVFRARSRKAHRQGWRQYVGRVLVVSPDSIRQSLVSLGNRHVQLAVTGSDHVPQICIEYDC